MPLPRALGVQEDRDSSSDSNAAVLTAGPTAGWVSGMGWGVSGMGERCSCYAEMTGRFLQSWCSLVHTTATPRLLQPALRLQS